MAGRQRRTSGREGGPPITVPAWPRLVAWLVAQGGAFWLFSISHFLVVPCALCRLQQVLALAFVVVMLANLTDKRPKKLMRLAHGVAVVGLIVSSAHLFLSSGSDLDPCSTLLTCAHPGLPTATAALPAAVSLVVFTAVLVLLYASGVTSIRRTAKGAHR
jgi:hypothetical protein